MWITRFLRERERILGIIRYAWSGIGDPRNLVPNLGKRSAQLIPCDVIGTWQTSAWMRFWTRLMFNRKCGNEIAMTRSWLFTAEALHRVLPVHCDNANRIDWVIEFIERERRLHSMEMNYHLLFKILLVGDAEVGNSVLLHPSVDDSTSSAIGVNFLKKKIEIGKET